MKLLKQIVVVTLVAAMVLSLTACHKKDEIAVTYGDVTFTSGVYAMALLNADSEARTKVDEANTEGTAITDYTKETVEDTPYVEWVEAKALENLRTQAAYRTLCRQNGLTLDEETITGVDSYVNYYFPYYQAMLEANGIGRASYRETMLGDAYSDLYFKSLYGENGSKAVPAQDIKDAYNASYRTVIMLDAGLSSLTEEADIAAAKAKVDDAKAKIDAHTAALDVYNEFNSLTDDAAVTDVKNILSLVSDAEADANYGLDCFAAIKDLKDGEGYVWNDEANNRYTLVIAVDTSADDSFFDQVKDTVLWAMKQEEYDADVAAFAAGLEEKVNKSAVKAFPVKKIDYGTAAA